jgi:L-alanine-DL-glutamate epimerase-like enolase superfamily enzyme
VSAPPRLTVETRNWPIAGSFTISRETRTSVDVVVATIEAGGQRGRGECRPYPRYGESVDGVAADIMARAAAIAGGMGRDELRATMAPGAARNAIDCALWDLEAKTAGTRAWALAGFRDCAPIITAFTISLGAPETMAAAAAAADRPLLKLKLGADGDAARIAAVRTAVPDIRLIVDANEGWQPDRLEELMAACHAARVEMIEQPLPAGHDDALARIARPVPVCADESAHDLAGLSALAGKYDAINIKLDKTGGLTEALALARAVRASGMAVMAGCMLATSLSMAPAMIVAQLADVADLDGPLLLARDQDHPIRYDGSLMYPPEAALWG